MDNSSTKVIGIISCRYSGSTMLDYMLGSHTNGLSLTELRAFIAGNRKPFTCKTCFPPEKCPVWIPELTARLIDYPINSQIYEDISRHAQKSLLVDSSKNLKWFKKTFSGLADNNKLMVLILKSPHRYVASEFTKVHKSAPKKISDAVHLWLHHNLTFLHYLSTSGVNYQIVRYEDLVNQAPQVLSNILGALGLEYQNRMELYWEHQHHPLWGNPGARSHFKQSDTSNPENFDLSEVDRKIYQQRKQTLYLDDKWKTVLDKSAIDEIYNSPFVGKLCSKFDFHNPNHFDPKNDSPQNFRIDKAWVTQTYWYFMASRHYPRWIYRKLFKG